MSHAWISVSVLKWFPFSLSLFLPQRSWEVKAARKADDLLESYMGIRDMELGGYPVSVKDILLKTKIFFPHSTNDG